MGRSAGEEARLSNLDGKAPESTDFANYFCTYAYLYHQKDMLEDHKRTGAYYNAVLQNRRQFHGKVVLDVGTGSGILAIFAAKAGARKVYAVEATDMAKQARTLVEANKFSDVIEVIQGTIESIELPEKVDVIISEWMGYFLLRESMLDSVVLARDKFMAPGGAMYPSHARMFLAPIHTEAGARRNTDFQGSMEGWAEFIGEMSAYYQVDLSCLSEPFRREQRDYYLQTSQWCDVHPSQLLGPGTPFVSYDLGKVTVEELKAGIRENFEMAVVEAGPVNAFCGWFDVQFRGSDASPADSPVTLTTAPDPTGATHWGQQSFYCVPPIDCAAGATLKAAIKVDRRRDNHRLLAVELAVKVEGQSGGARELKWNIE
ncbi:arginine N-methyltransferase [Raphidocelis subcapitata]|uniref:Arginine N-methyltransferase n=1 Tax=Raphidocelis subcapitata TaxID=307507 RepID=A0A2V0PAV8_9CHLO|nr:arginine N-methyltransferase [Raphidocelis subcapitata]|eukprot:GBF96659.1 arginine N-methyltransferase [Raphidocelis subcapitata]